VIDKWYAWLDEGFDGLLVESWKDMGKLSLDEGLFQSFGISSLTLIGGEIRDGSLTK